MNTRNFLIILSVCIIGNSLNAMMPLTTKMGHLKKAFQAAGLSIQKKPVITPSSDTSFWTKKNIALAVASFYVGRKYEDGSLMPWLEKHGAPALRFGNQLWIIGTHKFFERVDAMAADAVKNSGKQKFSPAPVANQPVIRPVEQQAAKPMVPAASQSVIAPVEQLVSTPVDPVIVPPVVVPVMKQEVDKTEQLAPAAPENSTDSAPKATE